MILQSKQTIDVFKIDSFEFRVNLGFNPNSNAQSKSLIISLVVELLIWDFKTILKTVDK